nr:immunoglobulin light chain junction region [Macaca mulatta]MOW03213.1 immunoglobulin light chain junction region [Macaca mulatta]
EYHCLLYYSGAYIF